MLVEFNHQSRQKSNSLASCAVKKRQMIYHRCNHKKKNAYLMIKISFIGNFVFMRRRRRRRRRRNLMVNFLLFSSFLFSSFSSHSRRFITSASLPYTYRTVGSARTHIHPNTEKREYHSFQSKIDYIIGILGIMMTAICCSYIY